jgi:hypothetical protein
MEEEEEAEGKSSLVTTAFTLIIVTWTGKHKQARKHAISVAKLPREDEKRKIRPDFILENDNKTAENLYGHSINI